MESGIGGRRAAESGRGSRRSGVAGDFGASYFLTRLVGPSKARELLFLSDKISAEEAARLGRVNRGEKGDDLQAATMQLATRLAELGSKAPLLMIMSAGSLTSVETAMRFPIRLVESGPAGGGLDIGQEIDRAEQPDNRVVFHARGR